MDFSGKIISVFGDSISTYEGYTASPGVFYDRFIQKLSGVDTVEKTWWMQVIRRLGGRLGVNDSFSGSTVYGNLAISGTASGRLKNLGHRRIPDVILIYMGTNDWGSYVMPEEFRACYRRMLRSMEMFYPDTEIYCGTLLRGKDPEDGAPDFMNVEGCLSQNIYSDIIRTTAAECGAKVADLAKYALEYGTIDGSHPNEAGMKLLADLWIKELQG